MLSLSLPSSIDSLRRHLYSARFTNTDGSSSSFLRFPKSGEPFPGHITATEVILMSTRAGVKQSEIRISHVRTLKRAPTCNLSKGTPFVAMAALSSAVLVNVARVVC